MNNLTGTLFGLLALWLYLLSVNDSHKPDRRQSHFLYGLATLSLLAALLSKPTAAVIPLMGAAFEALWLRRPVQRWVYQLGFWMVPSAACAIVNSIVAQKDNSAVWSPLWGRPFVVLDALAFNVVKLFAPIGLTFDYGRSPHSVLAHWWGYFTWILPVGLLFGVWRFKGLRETSGYRVLSLSSLLFVIGLMSTLGIVPYYTQWVSSVADRYLYLAMLGPAIAVAYILSLDVRSRRIVIVAYLSATGLLVLQTVRTLPIWHDMNSLTDSMLAANPNSWMAHGNEGYICGARGDLDRALFEFRIADKLEQPRAATNRFFIGVTLAEMGRFDEAVSPLADAFALNPADDEICFQLWNALAVLKRLPEAQAVLQKHLTSHPADGRAELNMGKMLVVGNQPRLAIPYLAGACRALPTEPAAEFFLGTALEQCQDHDGALHHFERAATLDPGRAEITAAVHRLRGIP